MMIRRILFPEKKRPLPFVADKSIKMLFRIAHVLSFGILFGGAFFEVEGAAAYASVTFLSGLLIMLREIYKDGTWLCQTRGVLTISKILLLFALIAIGAGSLVMLLPVAIIGILTSHLPKVIRKETLLSFCEVRDDADQ
jgi:hypothetical protein